MGDLTLMASLCYNRVIGGPMLNLDYETNFPFYRCEGCGRFINHLDVLAAFKTGILCPCGANEVSPTNPRWYEYLTPTFWRMVIAMNREG